MKKISVFCPNAGKYESKNSEYGYFSCRSGLIKVSLRSAIKTVKEGFFAAVKSRLSWRLSQKL